MMIYKRIVVRSKFISVVMRNVVLGNISREPNNCGPCLAAYPNLFPLPISPFGSYVSRVFWWLLFWTIGAGDNASESFRFGVGRPYWISPV